MTQGSVSWLTHGSVCAAAGAAKARRTTAESNVRRADIGWTDGVGSRRAQGLSRTVTQPVNMTFGSRVVQACAMPCDSGDEHDLPVGAPRSQGLEGVGNPVERVAGADHGPNRLSRVHAKERSEDLGNARRLVELVGPPMETDDGDVLEQDAVCLDLGNPPPGKADDQQPAAPRDALERLVEDVAADRIVDHVRA